MSTNKVVGGFAMVLAVAAIVFAIWQTNRVRGMQAAVANERAAFRGQLETLEARLVELESKKSVVPATAERGATSVVPVSDDGRPEQQRLAEERRYQQELARRRAQEAKAVADAERNFLFNPEIQERHFRHFQLSVSSRYRSLYRALGLSAEQVQEFERLLAERYWKTSDLMAARMQQGAMPGLTQTEFAELTAAALGPLDEQLRGLLGDVGFERYAQFENSVPVHGLVESLAGRIAGAAEPLSATQWDEIGAVLATHNLKRESWNRSWLAGEITGAGTSGAAWADIAWEPAMQQLAGVLSPAQLSVLQALREQTELRRAVAARREELVRERRLQQPAAPPIAPPAAPR